MTSADEKQDSPRVLRKTSDQVTQEMDKKVVFPCSTNDSPALGNDQVSPPSQTAVDGPDHVKTRLVPASVVSEFGECRSYTVCPREDIHSRALNEVKFWCQRKLAILFLKELKPTLNTQSDSIRAKFFFFSAKYFFLYSFVLLLSSWHFSHHHFAFSRT